MGTSQKKQASATTLLLIAALEGTAKRVRRDGERVATGIWIGDATVEEDDAVAVLGRELDEDEEGAVEDWADLLREDDDAWEEVAGCHVVPRGGMLSYYVTVRAVPLPSGYRIYIQLGDAGDCVLGVARAGIDHDAFLSRVSLPFDIGSSFSTGDTIHTIDGLLAGADEGSFQLEHILDFESEFLDHDRHGEAEGIREKRHAALLEAAEAGEVGEEEADHILDVPAWFLLLEPADFAEVAKLEVPVKSRGRDGIRCSYVPWRAPSADDFQTPGNPASLQHIVAAYVVGQWRF